MSARILAATLALLVVAYAAPSQAVTIDRVVSPGGIEAWLVQDHTLPIVTMQFAFPGGAVTDPEGKAGRATFTASLLDEGAGDLDSQAFQGKLEDLASSVHFTASHDYVTGSFSALKKNKGEVFELLRLSMTAPRFDAEAVARIRGELLSELARHDEQPNQLASEIWWRDAFPGHPYGRRVDGDAAGIQALSVEDFRQFVKERFAREGLIIGVVGDISPDELKAQLDRTFGGLPQTPAPFAVPSVAPDDAGAVLLARKPIPQSVAIFGEPGVKRDDPDWYAASIDNYVLGGGGFTSRLMSEVREKRGLAYSVSTYLVPLRQTGIVLGTVATQNEHVAESLDLIRAQWRRLHDEGPTAQEIADAKTFLTGSFPLQFDSTGRIAGLLVQLQEDKLGIDFLERRNALIEGVSLVDAKRVAARLFDPVALSVTIVGTPAGLTPTREVAPQTP